MLVKFPLSLEIALTPMRSSRFKSGPRHHFFCIRSSEAERVPVKDIVGISKFPGYASETESGLDTFAC
jgi:hypothetical protein